MTVINVKILSGNDVLYHQNDTLPVGTLNALTSTSWTHFDELCLGHIIREYSDKHPPEHTYTIIVSDQAHNELRNFEIKMPSQKVIDRIFRRTVNDENTSDSHSSSIRDSLEDLSVLAQGTTPLRAGNTNQPTFSRTGSLENLNEQKMK